MVNELAVRILLECILVESVFTRGMQTVEANKSTMFSASSHTAHVVWNLEHSL